MKIRNKPRALGIPADTPSDQAWIYGLGYPVQLSSTEAGLFAHIGRKDLLGQKKGDLVAGTDMVLFDRIDPFVPKATVPLNRGYECDHPGTGERLLMSAGNVVGGFVPLGALREDGSPHPHAGTGFGLHVLTSYPLGRPGGPEALDDPFTIFRCQQFRYDGTRSEITQDRETSPHDVMPDYEMRNHPLRFAIPDGDDLLMALGIVTEEIQATDIESCKTGIARWRRDESGEWRVHDFNLVCGAENTYEPTIERDLDGALLVTARPTEHNEGIYDIYVWRSEDGGATWEEALREGPLRSGPISINCAADGSPYIASGATHTPEGVKREYEREAITIWPLADDRRSLLDPIIARDGLKEFGRNSEGHIRAVDHPSGRTLRLSDGQWRHLLGFRILSPFEIKIGLDETVIAVPGVYLDELVSDGEPAPEWRF